MTKSSSSRLCKCHPFPNVSYPRGYAKWTPQIWAAYHVWCALLNNLRLADLMHQNKKRKITLLLLFSWCTWSNISASAVCVYSVCILLKRVEIFSCMSKFNEFIMGHSFYSLCHCVVFLPLYSLWIAGGSVLYIYRALWFINSLLSMRSTKNKV